MQQKMTSKIHASMFRTKELSESDGQNNAAISLLLRKKTTASCHRNYSYAVEHDCTYP